MLEMVNLPYDGYLWREWFDSDADRLRRLVEELGVDGVEVICGDEGGMETFPAELIKGWHLIFYADWLDLWRDDEAALRRKFGTPEVWREFYKAADSQAMEAAFARDFDRAAVSGAKYAVFHVSDVSINEVFDFHWLHSNEEIIDAAAELINRLTEGKDYQFDLLLENLPWPGFRFDDAALTRRLLEQVHYPKKGIMLDIGHLMSTNNYLTDEQQAADYIMRRLDEHGDMCRYIKGFHLHTSLSGAYVRECLANPPKLPEGDVYQRFAASYQHILRIDEHKPCRTAALRKVIERVQPEYLVHELAAATIEDKVRVVQTQRASLSL